jgi:hypothetical protein
MDLNYKFCILIETRNTIFIDSISTSWNAFEYKIYIVLINCAKCFQ